MAKKTGEVATRDEMLPAWVTQDDGAGVEQTEDLQGSSPFLYCVQSQTKDDELKDAHGLGGVVILPAGVGVAGLDVPFDVVPLFFWLSWRKERDYDEHSDEFWLMGSTTNMEDPIAVRARNFETRMEQYAGRDGKTYEAQYVECINMIAQIDSGPAAGNVGQVTFCKGSYKAGKKISQYLGRKKPTEEQDGEGNPVMHLPAVYMNRLKMLCGARKNTRQETYYGLEAHPAESPWVAADQVELFRECYEGFKKEHAAGSLVLGTETAPAKPTDGDEAATNN